MFISDKELETLVADSDEVVACNTCDSANVEKFFLLLGLAAAEIKIMMKKVLYLMAVNQHPVAVINHR